MYFNRGSIKTLYKTLDPLKVHFEKNILPLYLFFLAFWVVVFGWEFVGRKSEEKILCFCH